VSTPHIKHITGPTILMGDGSYFDFGAPESCSMTIADVAYGLGYTARFRGQTRIMRSSNRRCFYSVAEHCVRMSFMLEWSGYAHLALAGLMHEAGEVVLGDLPSPAKLMLPEFKALEKRCEAHILARFGIAPLSADDARIIKDFDLRMLATEKRDLMVGTIPGDHWEMLDGFKPFETMIVFPHGHPDDAAESFIARWRELTRPEAHA
jgi:hypothetical protein